jgi:hypothetical protein
MGQTTVYVRVFYDEKSDLLGYSGQSPLNGPFPKGIFIEPAKPMPPLEDRTCWSLTTNPVSLDVCAGESQAFELCAMAPNGDWVAIPSECGYEVPRMVLRGDRVYTGYIKVVSSDTWAKSFKFRIDATSPTSKVTVVVDLDC